MNKYVIIVSILIGLIVGALGGNWWAVKNMPAAKPPTVDTLYVSYPAKPETVIVKAVITKIKCDTVFVDTSKGFVEADTAKTIRTFEGYGEFNVSYLFPPRNEFIIIFAPFPKTETIITKTIYLPQYVEHISWYNDPWFNRTVGFGLGIGAAILIHKGLK